MNGVTVHEKLDILLGNSGDSGCLAEIGVLVSCYNTLINAEVHNANQSLINATSVSEGSGTYLGAYVANNMGYLEVLKDCEGSVDGVATSLTKGTKWDMNMYNTNAKKVVIVYGG